MEKVKYNLIVGKNKTGKTKYLSEIEDSIDIFKYHLIDFDSVQKYLYIELMKKNDIDVKNSDIDVEKLEKEIENIEELTKKIKKRLLELKKSSFKVDKELGLLESVFKVSHNSIENKGCLICDNSFDIDVLIEKQRGLAKYIEQQHINYKNKIDYDNLKMQYKSLENQFKTKLELLEKIQSYTSQHSEIYDNFITEIETKLKEELGIEKPSVNIDNGMITISPVMSRTNRVYLSFIIANYLYKDKCLIFDDIGLDTDNLKSLIKFIHEKKYENKIYISSLIKPKGRTLQSWNIIELCENS